MLLNNGSWQIVDLFYGALRFTNSTVDRVIQRMLVSLEISPPLVLFFTLNTVLLNLGINFFGVGKILTIDYVNSSTVFILESFGSDWLEYFVVIVSLIFPSINTFPSLFFVFDLLLSQFRIILILLFEFNFSLLFIFRGEISGKSVILILVVGRFGVRIMQLDPI